MGQRKLGSEIDQQRQAHLAEIGLGRKFEMAISEHSETTVPVEKDFEAN